MPNGNSGNVTLALSDGSTMAILDELGRFNQVQNFQFQDANHTQWSYSDIQQKIIQYEIAHGHTVYGTPGSDTLDPGQGGGFYLSGGGGNDTYVFGMGYGHDIVYVGDTNYYGHVDTVLLNPDVDPSQVQVVRSGGSPDITLALSDGSALTILDEFDRFNQIQSFSSGRRPHAVDLCGPREEGDQYEL